MDNKISNYLMRLRTRYNVVTSIYRQHTGNTSTYNNECFSFLLLVQTCDRVRPRLHYIALVVISTIFFVENRIVNKLIRNIK